MNDFPFIFIFMTMCDITHVCNYNFPTKKYVSSCDEILKLNKEKCNSGTGS